jgi:hypothetical protein
MTRPIGNPASSKKSRPDPPTFTVTPVAGAGFNAAGATINFTPPAFDGKMPITSYSVTSSGGQTGSSASTVVNITGLSGGTSYTFTGNAANVIGPSSTAGPSPAIIPVTVPSTPTANFGQFNATVPYGDPPQLAIGWINSQSGGSAITDYEYSTNLGVAWRSLGVTGSPALVTVQSNTSPFITGTDYGFILRSRNAVGPSNFSISPTAYTARTVPQAAQSAVLTRISNTVARLTWTAGNNGGNPITSLLINSEPAANAPGLSYTTTDVDGTIDVTGPYVLNQSYRFLLYLTSAAGTSLVTASNYIVLNPSVAPNFVAPNFPNFVTPNFPNFVTPNFPNFVTPNFPNFVTPNFPNFVTPNFTAPCNCFCPDCLCPPILPACCGGVGYC